MERLVKEKESIAVGFFSDLESSWAATKLFREVVFPPTSDDFLAIIIIIIIITVTGGCSGGRC